MYQDDGLTSHYFPQSAFVTSTSLFLLYVQETIAQVVSRTTLPVNVSTCQLLTFRATFISLGVMRAENRRNKVAMAVTLRKLSATFASL